jgi:hypothetical protein
MELKKFSQCSIWAMGWMTEEFVFKYWQGQKIFLFSTVSILALKLTQHPI